jgi:glutamine amidotransferase
VIGVVDTGIGNLGSVLRALEAAGGEPSPCGDPERLRDAERIVLPGVGSFPDGMRALRARGFDVALERAREAGKPILGICLGMQLMAARGFEGEATEGLGWFQGEVVRLEPKGLRVPHVGWNETRAERGSPLFEGLPEAPDFYYVHSFHVRGGEPGAVDASCDYGGRFAAALRRQNVAATQFHPEKSQDHGLRLLANFLRWRC